MDIVKHISDLLFDHECVIIPGLGGFVSGYRPAAIHPVQHQFTPPAKNLMFNEALKNNDGLLANHMASEQKIAYEAALEQIQGFVSEVKKSLANGEKVSFENIGNLYLGYDGNLQFDQNEVVNYLKDVYGMSSFVSPAIRREAVSTPKVVRPVFAEESARNTSSQNAGMLVKIAASVIVVIALGFFGYGYFKNSTPELQETNLLTSINELVNHQPETESVAGDKKDQENVVMQNHKMDDNLIGEKTPDNDQPVEVSKTEGAIEPEAKTDSKSDHADMPESKPVVTPTITKKMYHLIAGSFLDVENTEKLISKYSGYGYQPSVLGPSNNGYYRVSIHAYLRKDEALVELKKAREQFNPDIWLLRR